MSNLEVVCKELQGAFQGVFSWKWDGRFEAILTDFAIGEKEKVREVLDRYLSKAWDISNINNAPEIVRSIPGKLGGIRSGQILFTDDPNQDTFVFCAWWPWGNGERISIRVGPCSANSQGSEQIDLILQCKGWFGV